MNLKIAFRSVVVLCLWILPAFATLAAAPGAVVPQKQLLAIPVTTSGSRSIACVVTLGPSNPVSAVAFSPDGKTLAVAGYREIVIWDLANAKLLKRIGGRQLSGSAHALAFLKEGRMLVVGEGTPQTAGAVRVFDVQTGQQTQAFEEPQDIVYSVAVSPDGKLLAAGGAEPLVRVWSLDDKKLITTIREHRGWVLGVAFSRDSKRLVTASADHSAKVWEVGSWSAVIRLPETEAVRGAAFATDGITVALAVGGLDQRSLRIRRSDNVRSIRTASTGAGVPLDVLWSTKNRIYVPCSDNLLRVFDSNGRTLATLSGHNDWVYSVALSADEAKLASVSGDGTVKLWNTADNKLIATFVQIVPRSDEWLILTPLGYFAASSPNVLQWKTQNVTTPPKDLVSVFQKPEIVRDALAGKKIAAPTVK